MYPMINENFTRYECTQIYFLVKRYLLMNLQVLETYFAETNVNTQSLHWERNIATIIKPVLKKKKSLLN